MQVAIVHKAVTHVSSFNLNGCTAINWFVLAVCETARWTIVTKLVQRSMRCRSSARARCLLNFQHLLNHPTTTINYATLRSPSAPRILHDVRSCSCDRGIDEDSRLDRELRMRMGGNLHSDKSARAWYLCSSWLSCHCCQQFQGVEFWQIEHDSEQIELDHIDQSRSSQSVTVLISIPLCRIINFTQRSVQNR